MILNYNFNEPFKFKPNYKDLREALAQILCEQVKSIHGKLFNFDGAYQMALYFLVNLNEEDNDDLLEYFRDELEEYFYDKAKSQYQ